MKSINDIVAIKPPRNPEEQFSALIYALPGVGKTTLAGSASEVESMGKVLLIDFEGGSTVLSDKYPNVDVAEVEDWEQVSDLIFFLTDEENEHEYRTVIWDTAGESQQFIMDDYTGTDGFEMWRRAWDSFQRAIKMLHKSKLNVIVLAHAERERGGLDNRQTIRPVFQGKKSHETLPQVFDAIYYLHIDEEDEKTRMLLTQPTSDTIGKDRLGLPFEIADPTFAKIMKHIADNKKNTEEEGK